MIHSSIILKNNNQTIESMKEQPSPLMKLMQTEGFKPFSGPDAIRVYQKAKTRLNMENIREDDLLNAISSLGVLLETEIALMYALQDQICTNCGKCCTDNKSLRLPKTELKQIAKYRNDNFYADSKSLPGRDQEKMDHLRSADAHVHSTTENYARYTKYVQLNADPIQLASY